MSEGRFSPENYLNLLNIFLRLRFSRTRFLIPHFILFPLFAFAPSGAVDKIVLPVGIQSVDFSWCDGITGTAGSRMSEVLFI
jgi:hypothetical protein